MTMDSAAAAGVPKINGRNIIKVSPPPPPLRPLELIVPEEKFGAGLNMGSMSRESSGHLKLPLEGRHEQMSAVLAGRPAARN